jgi:hypothetical protein
MTAANGIRRLDLHNSKLSTCTDAKPEDLTDFTPRLHAQAMLSAAEVCGEGMGF